MKSILILTVICSVALGDVVTDTLMFDGLDRIYHVYTPPGFEPGLPMVYDLPGYDCSAMLEMNCTRMIDVADTANFVVVYPEAIDKKWNSGLGDHPDFPTPDVDDIGFLSALIDTLFAEYAIDTNRVYSMGISNGAMMSFRLAGDLNHRIRKIASVVGTLTPTIVNSLDGVPEIPVLFFSGTDDPILPYTGDDVSYSGQELADFWVSHNQCFTPVDSFPLPDYNPDDGSTLTFFPYNGETAESQTMYFRMEGGGHTFPGSEYLQAQKWDYLGTRNMDMNAATMIWEFFNCDSFSINGVWATDLHISAPYASPGSQILSVTASIINTEGNDYSAYAVVFDKDTTVIDSFQVHDDGKHGDGSADDGLAGTALTAPDEEGFYTIRATSTNLESGAYRGPHDLVRFTTAGPVSFIRYDMFGDDQVPNPGDTFFLYIHLLNSSVVLELLDIEARLSTEDTLLSVDTSKRSIGNIAPGDTTISWAFYTISISDSCPDNYDIPIKVEIYSASDLYWIDEFTIHVSAVDIVESDENIPTKYSLHHNYPNPFNPVTTISYDLPEPSHVVLKIYDVRGVLIRSLESGYQDAGSYQLQWNGRDQTDMLVGAGVYFCRLETPGFYKTVKMLFLK